MQPATSTRMQHWHRPDCYMGPTYDGWLVAYGITRDSEALERSNMTEFVQALKQGRCKDGASYQYVRDSHWACGWVETLYVKPGTAADRIAQELTDRLANYPVLNEEAYSKLEFDEQLEWWDHFGEQDARNTIAAADHYPANFTPAEHALWEAASGQALDDTETARLLFRDWTERGEGGHYPKTRERMTPLDWYNLLDRARWDEPASAFPGLAIMRAALVDLDYLKPLPTPDLPGQLLLLSV